MPAATPQLLQSAKRLPVIVQLKVPDFPWSARPRDNVVEA
jgi:hypothetical protein